MDRRQSRSSNFGVARLSTMHSRLPCRPDSGRSPKSSLEFGIQLLLKDLRMRRQRPEARDRSHHFGDLMALLVAGIGSAVAEETVAVLLTLPAATGDTEYVLLIVTV